MKAKLSTCADELVNGDTALSHLRNVVLSLSCHAPTSRCRFTNFNLTPPQYAESHNLLFHSMTHWYQHHQSAAGLQKAGYYFRSVSLFSSFDGTSCELSTHLGTLLVITTFMLEWLTERFDSRMDGLQSLSVSRFAYHIQCPMSLILQHPFNFHPLLISLRLLWTHHYKI